MIREYAASFRGEEMKILFITLCLFAFTACSKNQKNTSIEIKDVLQAHNQAEDFHQWMESSNHPIEYFKNKEVSCQSLRLLSEESLSVFYQALESEEAKTSLSKECRTELINKIEAYYFDSTKQNKIELSQANQHRFLETRQVVVDTAGGPVFWYGNRGGLNKKEVSLTFDDGPHPKLTLMLLDILDEFNIKATFFVLGKNAKAYPHLVKEIEYRGHVLANHSYNHNNLPKYNFDYGVNEIESGFDEVLKITDNVAPFFRFPYGAKTSALQQYLHKTDVATFFWDVDTLDWKKTNPKELLRYSTEQVYRYNNGIVLFHDIQPQTIAVMRGFISELLLNKYTFAQHVPH